MSQNYIKLLNYGKHLPLTFILFQEIGTISQTYSKNRAKLDGIFLLGRK